MVREFWTRAVSTASRIVVPDVCAGCGLAGSWVCDDCYVGVEEIDLDLCCQRCGLADVDDERPCRRCRMWHHRDVRVRSKFEFDGPMRESILRMKYRGEFARAKWHADHLLTLFSETDWDEPDILLAVPLHPSKLRQRGYNQSEHLARHLSLLLSVPVGNHLVRVRNTPSQTTLKGDDRRRNVSGSFVCSAFDTRPNVLLIDDVVTTGSTLLECASACIKAGAGSVRSLTLASGQ